MHRLCVIRIDITGMHYMNGLTVTSIATLSGKFLSHVILVWWLSRLTLVYFHFVISSNFTINWVNFSITFASHVLWSIHITFKYNTRKLTNLLIAVFLYLQTKCIYVYISYSLSNDKLSSEKEMKWFDTFKFCGRKCDKSFIWVNPFVENSVSLL